MYWYSTILRNDFLVLAFLVVLIRRKAIEARSINVLMLYQHFHMQGYVGSSVRLSWPSFLVFLHGKFYLQEVSSVYTHSLCLPASVYRRLLCVAVCSARHQASKPRMVNKQLEMIRNETVQTEFHTIIRNWLAGTKWHNTGRPFSGEIRVGTLLNISDKCYSSS